MAAKLSMESIQIDFSEKMHVVYDEVKRSAHIREEVENLQSEKHRLDGLYGKAKIALKNGTEELQRLGLLNNDLEAEKNNLERELRMGRKREREKDDEAKRLNQEIRDLKEAAESSAVSERGLMAIKTLGLDSKKIDTLEKDCSALRLENKDLQQRLADITRATKSMESGISEQVCHREEATHSWGVVHRDIMKIMSLLHPGSKSQEDLRTALGAIMNMYTLEPRTATYLAQYLKSNRTSSTGHQCLYSIVSNWPIGINGHADTNGCKHRDCCKRYAQ